MRIYTCITLLEDRSDMMAKKNDSMNLEQILFNCRDYLRAARNSGSFF